MKHLALVPITIREAKRLVTRWHRHHRAPQGAIFAVAVAPVIVDAIGDICGVAMIGRPVARKLDNGWTVEVVRVAIDPEMRVPNCCSMLYGAAWRAARAMGYHKAVTYTLASESGTSVKAAGWKCIGEAGGGEWDRTARPRVEADESQRKFRWEVAA